MGSHPWAPTRRAQTNSTTAERGTTACPPHSRFTEAANLADNPPTTVSTPMRGRLSAWQCEGTHHLPQGLCGPGHCCPSPHTHGAISSPLMASRPEGGEHTAALRWRHSPPGVTPQYLSDAGLLREASSGFFQRTTEEEGRPHRPAGCDPATCLLECRPPPHASSLGAAFSSAPPPPLRGAGRGGDRRRFGHLLLAARRRRPLLEPGPGELAWREMAAALG